MGCSVAVETTSKRQEEILKAARRVLADEGVSALTMGRLARELEIKAPSLYKHFEGKDDVLDRLVAEGLVEQAQALEAAGPGLLAQARAYRRFAVASPELYRLMTERPLPRERLPEGLEQRAAVGLVDAVGQDLARAGWAFAHGMVELELDRRFPPGADLEAAWAAGVGAFEHAAVRRLNRQETP